MTRAATHPHVVIVGGGFGGLYAARALASHPVRVTLLDRRNHHLFQPLLYQVATAALNASDIAAPLRSVLRKAANITVLLAEVKGSMATIGRAAAVAVVGRVRLSGLVAWLAWLLVHIMFLIGFRNRFLVLFDWAWAYVTWQRGARLITRPWKGRDRAQGGSGPSRLSRAERRGSASPRGSHPV